MVIEKVEILHTSPPEKGGGRVLRIKTDKVRFETPTRAVSSTESNYKKTVGCDDFYENPIFEIIGIFNERSIASLHTRNGPFASRRRNINAMVRQYEDMNSIFHIQPQWGRRDLTYSEKDIKFLVELQSRAKLEFIKIPDMSINSKPEVFEKMVIGYSDFVKDQFQLEPVPLLDLSMDHELFKKKLNVIIDNKTGTFNIVAFQHRSFNLYAANYGHIWDKRDEEIWFHLSGINRLHPAHNWTTAQLHYPQRFGIDTVARLTQQVPIEVPPKPLLEVKRYDSGTLGIIPLKEHRSRFGDNLLCSCPICENKSLTDFIENLKIDQHGNESSSTLDTWSKIHEAFSSTAEFEVGRDAIRNDELKQYFRGKERYKGLKL